MGGACKWWRPTHLVHPPVCTERMGGVQMGGCTQIGGRNKGGGEQEGQQVAMREGHANQGQSLVKVQVSFLNW